MQYKEIHYSIAEKCDNGHQYEHIFFLYHSLTNSNGFHAKISYYDGLIPTLITTITYNIKTSYYAAMNEGNIFVKDIRIDKENGIIFIIFNCSLINNRVIMNIEYDKSLNNQIFVE